MLLYNFPWSVQAGDATGMGFVDCIPSTSSFSWATSIFQEELSFGVTTSAVESVFFCREY